MISTPTPDAFRPLSSADEAPKIERRPTDPAFAEWVASQPIKGLEDGKTLTPAQRAGLLLDRAPRANAGIDPLLSAPGLPHYMYGELDSAMVHDEGARAHGVDAGGDGLKIGNAVITYAVVGTAEAGALEWDQAWFGSQIGDVPVDATFAIATVTPSSTRFTNAQVADWLSFQPFCQVNMNLVAASADAMVSGLQMVPIRLTPFGTSAESTIHNLQYQTTADFQTSRGQIPFSEIVDGYTYLRIITPIQAVAGTYSVSFLCGLRPDRRSQVPKLPAQLLNSSGVSR